MSGAQKSSSSGTERFWKKEEILLLRGLLGGFGNSVSVFVTSPLDVLKIRFQMQGQLTSQQLQKEYPNVLKGALFVIRNEGFAGLYKGLTVSVVREMTFTSARFMLYEPFRAIFEGKDKGRESTLTSKILSGLTSGAIAAGLFNPTDVLKIRFQAAVKTRYRGVIHAVISVFKEEGMKGFYKGVGTTIVRASVLTSAQLASYDHSKHLLMKNFGFGDRFLTHLSASIVSGFVSSFCSSPIDVVRTRVMNESATTKDAIYRSPISTFFKIVRTEGLLALYKGFVPSYIRLGLCTAIAFTISEQLRLLLHIPTI